MAPTHVRTRLFVFAQHKQIATGNTGAGRLKLAGKVVEHTCVVPYHFVGRRPHPFPPPYTRSPLPAAVLEEADLEAPRGVGQETVAAHYPADQIRALRDDGEPRQEPAVPDSPL